MGPERIELSAKERERLKVLHEVEQTIDKVLSDMADYHVPILVGIFGAGTALAWFHHFDPSYVSVAGLVISAVTGHAIFSKKSGDRQ
jgi:hypothetical protein